MGNTFQLNDFIQVANGGISSFGIVADFNGSKTAEEATVMNLMLVDMPDDFGTFNVEVNEMRTVDEEEIRTNLAHIADRYEEFPYFIIQLNDIEALASYHIEENEYLHNIRKTNEVLNS